jgi:hypothetical protein
VNGSISLVRAIQATGILSLCMALAGCSGSKVIIGNYEKIKDGMSLKEVEGILGTGKEQASSGVNVPGVSAGGVSVPGMQMSGKAMVWQDGNKSITVTFINDKVAGKAQSGL